MCNHPAALHYGGSAVMASIPSKRFVYYTLVHPNGYVFYVGQGSVRRSISHLSEARRGGCDCRKCIVIREVWSAGGDVRIEYPFETNNWIDVTHYEKQLIQEMSQRYALCNTYHKVRGEPLPPKPLVEMTLDEVRNYYEHLFLTKAEYAERLEGWMRSRSDHLIYTYAQQEALGI